MKDKTGVKLMSKEPPEPHNGDKVFQGVRKGALRDLKGKETQELEEKCLRVSGNRESYRQRMFKGTSL